MAPIGRRAVLDAIQAAFEKTWRGDPRVKKARFFLSDIVVLTTDAASATATYTYNWEGSQAGRTFTITGRAVSQVNPAARALLDLLQPLALLAARLHVAQVFFLSGLTKIGNWETTLALFEDEYHVPLLPSPVAALLGEAAKMDAEIQALQAQLAASDVARQLAVTEAVTDMGPEAVPALTQGVAQASPRAARNVSIWPKLVTRPQPTEQTT